MKNREEVIEKRYINFNFEMKKLKNE